MGMLEELRDTVEQLRAAVEENGRLLRQVAVMSRAEDGGKPFLNMGEAAEYTGLSKGYLYSLVSHRQIPCFKKGKYLYFRKDELNDWIEEDRLPTMEQSRQAAARYTLRKSLGIQEAPRH